MFRKSFECAWDRRDEKRNERGTRNAKQAEAPGAASTSPVLNIHYYFRIVSSALRAASGTSARRPKWIYLKLVTNTRTLQLITANRHDTTRNKCRYKDMQSTKLEKKNTVVISNKLLLDGVCMCMNNGCHKRSHIALLCQTQKSADFRTPAICVCWGGE